MLTIVRLQRLFVMRCIALVILMVCVRWTPVHAQAVPLHEIGGKVSFNFESLNDFILIDVKFKGVLPLRFIFDTGSEHTILLKKEYSDLLGVKYHRRIPLMGSDMSQEIYGYIARNLELTIENRAVAKTDILILEEDYLQIEEFTGIQIDGILGANIFRHFVVNINNKKELITFELPNRFKPPRSFDVVPIKIHKNKPYINAIARLPADSVDLRLLLDTGAGLPVLLYTNTHEDLELPDKTIVGNLGMGLGGNLEGYVGRLESFEFGGFEYPNMITSFQDLAIDSVLLRMRLPRNGLLGNSILRRFNYYIDYQREKLYIKPLRRHKKKFNFDKSGLIIAATGRHLRDFIIQRVLPGSPAEEAGLLPGDVIKKLRKLPATFYSLAAINSMLSGKEGKKISIVVARGDQRIKKKIKLRVLI